MGSKSAENLKLQYTGLVASSYIFSDFRKFPPVQAEELCVLVPVV